MSKDRFKELMDLLDSNDLPEAPHTQAVDESSKKVKFSKDTIAYSNWIEAEKKLAKQLSDETFINPPAKPASQSKNKMKLDNAQAHLMMPPAPIEAWEVQVFADADSMVHFQARSKPGIGCYTRWYVSAAAVDWEKVRSLWYAAVGTNQMRKSFYADSGKMYLICSRVSETAVNIPGYGVWEVPELFNVEDNSANSEE